MLLIANYIVLILIIYLVLYYQDLYFMLVSSYKSPKILYCSKTLLAFFKIGCDSTATLMATDGVIQSIIIRYLDSNYK